LDINVAGAEVFPVARELAERSIPFIFVSGYDADNLPQEWRSRPTLQKPFQPAGFGAEHGKGVYKIITAMRKVLWPHFGGRAR
jgi:hypothetical protein